GSVVLGVNLVSEGEGRVVVGLCNNATVDATLDAVFAVGVGTLGASGCSEQETGLVLDSDGNLFVKGNVFVQGTNLLSGQSNGMRRREDVEEEERQRQRRGEGEEEWKAMIVKQLRAEIEEDWRTTVEQLRAEIEELKATLVHVRRGR